MSWVSKQSIAKKEAQQRRAMSSYWFIAEGKTLKGPYTRSELYRQLEEGLLQEGSYCWKQGFHEWRPLCSVPELDLEAKPYRVLPYPEVDVPSAREEKRSSAPKAPKNKNAPIVRVKLEPNKRWDVSMWERFFMLVFAMLFASVALWVAFDEIQDGFLARVERHRVGERIELSVLSRHEEAPLPMEFWQPLLAAPGIMEWPDKQIPVSLRVWRAAHYPQEWGAADRDIVWQGPQPTGVQFQYAADPVYVQSYEMAVQWSPAQPNQFSARSLGYPGL